MAGTENAGQFPKNPLDKLGHTLHERFVGVGHAVQKHPFRIALAGVFVALGLEALHFQQYFGPPPVDNALISDTLKPPEGEQGVGIVITPTQEPKPTAESLKPTPTPEIKEVDSGLIDPEYNKYAEVIDWKNPSGKIIKIIGFRFPTGVKIPIYSPIEGQETKVKGDESTGIKGIVVSIFDPNLPNSQRRYYTLKGNIEVPNMLTVNVSKKQVLGYITARDIKAVGDFDLLYYVIIQSDIDEITEREQFPQPFQKPTVSMSYQGGVPKTTYTDTFYSNSPQ